MEGDRKPSFLTEAALIASTGLAWLGAEWMLEHGRPHDIPGAVELLRRILIAHEPIYELSAYVALACVAIAIVTIAAALVRSNRPNRSSQESGGFLRTIALVAAATGVLGAAVDVLLGHISLLDIYGAIDQSLLSVTYATALIKMALGLGAAAFAMLADSMLRQSDHGNIGDE